MPARLRSYTQAATSRPVTTTTSRERTPEDDERPKTVTPVRLWRPNGLLAYGAGVLVPDDELASLIPDDEHRRRLQGGGT